MNEWIRKKETAWEKAVRDDSICHGLVCCHCALLRALLHPSLQADVCSGKDKASREDQLETDIYQPLRCPISKHIRRRRCHHLLLLVVRVMLKAHQIDWAGYRGQVVPVPVLVKWKTASVVLATDKVRWVVGKKREKGFKLASPPWNTPVLHTEYTLFCPRELCDSLMLLLLLIDQSAV